MRPPLAMLPKGALDILKELGRHVLRRPVVGVAAAAQTSDGKWLLIRRADTGSWALPGGTLEWGETLREGLRRELLEEAGVTALTLGRLVGVYARPDRDPRFHGVTVVIACQVEPPSRPPTNPFEILEARLFETAELPDQLGMHMRDMLDAAMADGPAVFE